jgi:hypothetical protein
VKKILFSLALLILVGFTQALSKTGISGNFTCKVWLLEDQSNGNTKDVRGKSTDVYKVSLNGTSGVLTVTNKPKELLSFIKTISGPASLGNQYKFNNSTIWDSLQINIDHAPSGKGKSLMLLSMKPIGKSKIVMMGPCDY